jgi:prepilin-type N-terminal cleavage/methylation domain-containing protein
MSALSSIRRIKDDRQLAEQRPMLSRIRGRLLLRGDDGFTLMEAIVALAIAVIIFMALSFAMIGGAHEVLLAQQNQQAGDVVNQVVEQARSLGYDNLVMQNSDLANALDPIGSAVSSCKCYNPTTDGTTGSFEPLATAPVGTVNPHAKTTTLNGLGYKVREYVTTPTDGAGATYKRLTVVVSWKALGRTHNRTYSTFVSATKRGLPLPSFKFTPAQGSGLTACANPGSGITYSFTVKNNGARDQWLISSSQSTPAAALTWNYYIDANNNGIFDSASDTPLTTDAVSGLPSTGLLDPNGTLTFFATSTAPAAPGTVQVSFTATSDAIQTYMQTLATTTVVQSAACTGVVVTPTPTATTPATTPPTTPAPTISTPTQPSTSCPAVGTALTASSKSGTSVSYSLYNPNEPSNTAAAQSMPVVKSTPTQTTLYNYSTDLDSSSAGRALVGGTGDGTARYLATWSYGMPASSVITANGNGANASNGEVSVYASTGGNATATPVFTATLKMVNGATTTTIATGTYTTPAGGWGCSGGYHKVWINLPLPSTTTTVPANATLTLSISSSVATYLAYGTTSFPMEFSLPYTTAGMG